MNFFWRIPRILRQVCRVQIWRSWYFFKRDIQPRGKSTANNECKYKSSASFLPKGDTWGFSICHSWYLAEQNDTKKALILICSGFDQKSEFSYQPILPLYLPPKRCHTKWLLFLYNSLGSPIGTGTPFHGSEFQTHSCWFDMYFLFQVTDLDVVHSWFSRVSLSIRIYFASSMRTSFFQASRYSEPRVISLLV